MKGRAKVFRVRPVDVKAGSLLQQRDDFSKTAPTRCFAQDLFLPVGHFLDLCGCEEEEGDKEEKDKEKLWNILEAFFFSSQMLS